MQTPPPPPPSTLSSRVDNIAQLDDTVKNTLQVSELPLDKDDKTEDSTNASTNKKKNKKSACQYLSLGGHLIIDREQRKIYHMDNNAPVNYVVFQVCVFLTVSYVWSMLFYR